MALSGPKPTRPRTLLVLIIVLCWQIGRGIEALILSDGSTSYQFYRAMGLKPLSLALDGLSVAVALAALGYLWRARPGWVQSTLVALGYFALQAIVTTALMMRFNDQAQAAFIAGRSARGQTMDAQRVEQLFAMGWLEWRLVLTLSVFGVAAWLAWRRRDYVDPPDTSRRPSG